MNPDTALVKALPELRGAERKLRALAAKEGITYGIAAFGGFRTEADTSRILKYRDDDYAVYVSNMNAAGKTAQILPKEKWRRIAPFGRSFHDYGAAFDVQILTVPAGMTFKQALVHLGALAPSCGLRWGGSFDDPPHFELAISLTDAQKRWAVYTLPPASQTPSGLPVILAAIPQAIVPTITATTAAVKKHPAAAATVGLGAIVAAALLTWLVVKRISE